ncbi:unnamed protein product [Discosporangium mesarthrocarpum]
MSEAYPDVLSSREVCKGFERLFEMIDDIQLDAPNARTLVSSFLARAVADEILPPSVLRNAAFLSLGGEIVKGARRLLSRDHVLSRLEKVWGPGDGRPVEELKVAIDQLLVEYLQSKQLDEAATCVKELDCAHFHHEIVKRAVKVRSPTVWVLAPFFSCCCPLHLALSLFQPATMYLCRPPGESVTRSVWVSGAGVVVIPGLR